MYSIGETIKTKIQEKNIIKSQIKLNKGYREVLYTFFPIFRGEKSIEFIFLYCLFPRIRFYFNLFINASTFF